MIISSRQAIPNMSLRRTAALHSPGLSSRNTLSIPLIDSPLPSPVLPSIVPSHGKRPPGAGKRKAYRVFRLLVVCALFVALFRTSLLHSLSRWRFVFSDANYQLPATVPITVMPLIVKNRHGHRKWTIHIPADMEFPLSPPQITELCSRCSQMSQQNFDGKHASFDYSRPDPNFLDINDRNLVKSQSLGDPNKQNSQGSNVFCDKSLTFVLQADDAALGVTLMNLWISYGLARRQGRNFFIDDTNWAYGEFSMYFKPPPKPTCEQPPPHWRLPCPLQAKHLIVSSSNTPWVFGESFQKYFQGRFSVGETQQKELFDMARHGYEELFHLAGEDATYYHQRIRDFHKDVHSTRGITIGIHVRHGDSHPLEAQYRDSYIPLDRYAKRASSVFHAHLQQAHGDTALFQSIATNSKVILASDDPEVYRSMELGGAERAQNYIALASKAALDAATDMSLGSHLDENVGWEGGFFQDIFWSLGVDANDYSEIGGPFPSNQGPTKPKTLSSQSIAAQNHLGPSNQSLKLREWIARAYLLDLAVLGQSDRTVCDVSSASCRLLAVMMGWDKAIVRKFWQNIDGNWHWSFDMP